MLGVALVASACLGLALTLPPNMGAAKPGTTIEYLSQIEAVQPGAVRQMLLQSQSKALCVDQDNEVGSIAAERGYLNIRDCPYLVAKLKSQGETCESPLYIFGMPELKLSTICCLSCSLGCQDHDSAIAEVMAAKHASEYDTCDKAVLHLKEVDLDKNTRLNQFGFHNLTISDICCDSVHSMVWREPLPDAAPKPTPTASVKDVPQYVPKQPTGQFPAPPDPEEAQQVKMRQAVQTVRQGKQLQTLEARLDRLSNRTIELGETVAPNITVGNKTLSEAETVQYGQGYAHGFFQGYKSGFLRAEEDDLGLTDDQAVEDYLQSRSPGQDTSRLPPLYSEKERNKS